MNRRTVTLIAITFAGTALAQRGATQPLPSDLRLMVGMRVMVGRMPLCEPNTYTVDLAHAGKAAKIISVKPNNMTVKLSASTLERLPEQSRNLVEDAQNSGTILLEFEDGKRLDTCA